MKLAKAQCLDLLYRLIHDRIRTEYHCNVQLWYVPNFVLSAHQNLIAGLPGIWERLRKSNWAADNEYKLRLSQTIKACQTVTAQQISKQIAFRSYFVTLFFACYDDRHKYNKSTWLAYVYFRQFSMTNIRCLDQQGLIIGIQSYGIHNN